MIPLLAGLVAFGILVGLGSENKPKSKKKIAAKDKLKNKLNKRLVKNFKRLKLKLNSTSLPRIAIVGQPGAGKSTLIDIITNKSLNPRPTIGTKTDATDWSINTHSPLTYTYSEKVLCDSPGYNTKNHPHKIYISHFPFSDFDKIFFVFSNKLSEADHHIIKHISKSCRDVSYCRTACEGLSEIEKEQIVFNIKTVSRKKEVSVLFLSARFGYGIEDFLRLVGQVKFTSSSKSAA